MGNLEEQKLVGRKIIHQTDILPGTIKNRHLQSNVHAVNIGNIADRPDGTTHIKIWFSKDENKLYIWNETDQAWKSVTLV